MADRIRTSTVACGRRRPARTLRSRGRAAAWPAELRHVGDLVEEEGAAVGHLEASDAVALGVGEGALDVAEELALEDALGEAAGVDGDQRLSTAVRDGVQQLGDDALAGAVLAGDQDVGVGWADPLDQVQDRLHGA